MSFEIKIIRASELKTTSWSGGSTTQLAIWPPEADYAKRSFGWRISSAVVEEEESTFTALPGVHRHIMTLEGGIELEHTGISSRTLRPLSDIEEFEGSWETKSRGRCVDFNLMTQQGYNGSIACIPAGGQSLMLPFSKSPLCWKGIYAITDGLTIKTDAPGSCGSYSLRRGDFALMSYTPNNCGEIFITLTSVKMVIPAVEATVWQVPEGVSVVWSL